MTVLKAVSLLISCLLALSIWFYLQYKILVLVNASELMWFLFWVYVPATVMMAVLSKFIEKE